MNMDEYEQAMALRREIFLHDQTSMKARAYEEGEQKSKKEIAKNLLKNNVDIEIIIKSTGLTKEEIENLN